MNKKYNPADIEAKLYNSWMQKDYFKATVNPNKKPFTIIMPPPNITGQLHIGHAFTKTLQDSVIRFKRMQGYETLWLPGTDHAAIATEAKVVKYLKEKGITKEEIGREAFLGHMQEWYDRYRPIMIEQIKVTGASCDWSKLAFTLDDERSHSVKTAFVKLYDKGLIYEGSRIINWCPSCKTSISDIEVEYKESKSKLWHLKYPLEDGTGFVEVATTRPETIPGDTAVAVHPEDERYAHLVGKNVILPVLNKHIPIVADDYVEKDFGSGVVKITPAHDPNDYEVGTRHDLPIIRVMNDDGTMNELSGKYNGLTREECRKVLLQDFKDLGLFVSVKDHDNKTSHCERCKTMVEPIISKQWFVSMKELAKPAIKVVKEKEVKFHPARFEKVYMNWMENIHDWCISRQLWSGHRLPVFDCADCGERMVTVDAPLKCTKCNSTKIVQDENVLDTWFSSALWPYSTLGWPNKTPELEYFYPTQVMVTGYDIIFFWVARMIFTALEFTNNIPFEDVFINGLIRDSQGRKMSKNLNNGVDPLEIVKEYGADAMRFGLISNTSIGQDSKYKDENMKAASNFLNKLFNASKFVLNSAEGYKPLTLNELELENHDKWILNEYNNLVKRVTKLYEKYEQNMASHVLFEFIWNKFCDWYIEISKTSLYGDNFKNKNKTINVLLYVLKGTLKLLHPLTPFITEEIYLNLPGHGESIMISDFPVYDPSLEFAKEAEDMQEVMQMVKAVRNVRAEMGVKDNKKISIIINPISKQELFENSTNIFVKLAGANKVSFNEEVEEDKVTSLVFSNAKVYLPMGDMVDASEEKARLEKELKRIEAEITRGERMLSNEGFVKKAPAKLIETEKEKLAKNRNLLETIKESISKL